MSILQTLRNAWKIADLRKKILFTAFIIILFRIGANIPVPFVDGAVISAFFNPATGSTAAENLLGYLNMLSGNALAQGTVFALTIQPYINASIIIQLLTIAIPYFERLQKDGGEEGKKKLNAITRYVTVGIAIVQAIGYYITLNNSKALTVFTGFDNVVAIGAVMAALVGGTMLVIWLGECIDSRGIGNGISMILFASIVSRGTDLLMYMWNEIINGRWYVVVIIVILAILMFGLIVFMDSAERRIPVQYAKRQVGRKLYGGQSTHLPIKVCMTGVMPIIFAYAIVNLPATIAAFFPNSGFATFVSNYFGQKSAAYMIITFLLIIAFNYFYISIQYNTVEIANNIKNNGGTIPGIRPGKPTSDFISKVVNRVTFVGALFLGFIAVAPYIIQLIFPDSYGIGLGGTSMMIIVSVALETVKVLESQMLMRHYKGFLE